MLALFLIRLLWLCYSSPVKHNEKQIFAWKESNTSQSNCYLSWTVMAIISSQKMSSTMSSISTEINHSDGLDIAFKNISNNFLKQD